MQYPEKKPKASAREVIRNITKQSDPVQVAQAVDAALFAQWMNARTYQEIKKRAFELSFPEFLALITPSRRTRMEKAMAARNFERFMKSKYGYVLGWKSRKAFQTGTMSVTTAAFMNREDSERSTQFGPGDQHSQESKDLIRKSRIGKKASDKTKTKMSVAKKGKPRDAEARKAISEGLKGKSKTPEQKAKVAASVRARLAEKKAIIGKAKQWEENSQTKPAVEFPTVNEVLDIPMIQSVVSETRGAEKSYHLNIAKHLQRASGSVGQNFTVRSFEAPAAVRA